MISDQTVLERVGRNVALCMRSRGESIRVLAAAIEAKPTTIHYVLKGTTNPRFVLIARIAEHYGVGVDDLLLPTNQFVERLPQVESSC